MGAHMIFNHEVVGSSPIQVTKSGIVYNRYFGLKNPVSQVRVLSPSTIWKGSSVGRAGKHSVIDFIHFYIWGGGENDKRRGTRSSEGRWRAFLLVEIQPSPP